MSQTPSFSKTFAPARIGSVEIKNRIVMPSMVPGFTDRRGMITDRSIHYYVERAKGGAGLIIVEGSNPHRYGRSQPLHPDLYHDRFIPKFKELADSLHANGAKAGVQLIFSGAPALVGLAQLPAPSALGSRARELAREEITNIVESFGEAARRIRTAGFDMVEIHACHGSLVCLFLSPSYNRRTDEYGGREGRPRFALEILEAMKAKAGRDFPVIFRINGVEYKEGGVTLEDSKYLAQRLEQGGVDALSITSGIESRDPTLVFASALVPPGFRAGLAEEIKKVVKVPVMASGGITEVRQVEEILQKGQADFVALGKALIADPHLPRKAQEGRLEDIRPCIRCCEGCAGQVGSSQGVTCLGNAAVGKEEEYRIKPAAKIKKVLVIGGGPAGMEAARVLALRGHQVSLYEETERLGGQFRLAAVPPFKSELNKLVVFLSRQMDKLGVKVVLGKKITAKDVADLRPEAVILAAGSEPLVPPVPGVTGDNVVKAIDVLDGRAETGPKVIVLGGGRVGCETAEFLADQGKEVTVVEMLDEVARDYMFVPHRRELLTRLERKGVKIQTGTRVKEVTPKGIVTLKGVYGGTPPEEEIEGDTIVLAAGSKAREELIGELKRRAGELYVIGDCLEPRNALEAIHEGSRVARMI